MHMTPESILAQPPRILSQRQRESYFEQGYLLVEGVIPGPWLDLVRQTTEEMVDRSRALTESDQVWDLEVGHSADNPRLRRLSSPCDHDERYWRYVSESLLADIAADLLGPSVKFHHSKLNFKASGGGTDVKWHQDIQFWPHTNYSPLTIGTYLYDCGPDQGPLGVIPRSHQGPLFDLYDSQRRWTGHIADADLPAANIDRAQYLPGPAGSITIHNCRTIHGSQPNLSPSSRPLFLVAYSSGDAFPYTRNPLYSRYDGHLVRGTPPRTAHIDPRPCPLPPDWSGGYKSIFAYQQGEQAVAAPAM
jgi:hypothetical protein